MKKENNQLLKTLAKEFRIKENEMSKLINKIAANGRELPNRVALEQELLGSVIADGKGYFSIETKLSNDCFFASPNAYIWEAIQHIVDNGRTPSHNMIAERLKVMCQKDKRDATFLVNNEVISIDDYLLDLINIGAGRFYFLEQNAKHIYDAYMQRNIILRAKTMEAQAFDLEMPKEIIRDSFDFLQEKLLEEDTDKAYDYQDFKDSLENDTGFGEFKTGFPDLDAVLNGLERGDVFGIGAKSGNGKTSLVVSMLYHFLKQGMKGRFFSFEVPAKKMWAHLLSVASEWTTKSIRRKEIKEEHRDIGRWFEYDDFKRITKNKSVFFDEARRKYGITYNQADKMLDEWSKNKRVVIDSKVCDADELRMKVKRHKAEYGLDFIILDYVQLAGGEDDETTKINRLMKVLLDVAKEENILVIYLSQLLKTLGNSGNDNYNIPSLKHLKYSATMEEVSTKIIFLYNPSFYGYTKMDAYGIDGEDAVVSTAGMVHILVLKNKEEARIRLGDAWYRDDGTRVNHLLLGFIPYFRKFVPYDRDLLRNYKFYRDATAINVPGEIVSPINDMEDEEIPF